MLYSREIVCRIVDQELEKVGHALEILKLALVNLYWAFKFLMVSLEQAVFDKVKPKTVFHVACPNSTIIQPEIFWRVNVGGARNLLDASKKVNSVHAFVYTSSSSVSHTNTKDALNIDESAPILQAPIQKRIYTLTKAEAEIQILAANRANGDSSMLTASIRPAAIFGERDFICAGKIVANARQGKAGYQARIHLLTRLPSFL